MPIRIARAVLALALVAGCGPDAGEVGVASEPAPPAPAPAPAVEGPATPDPEGPGPHGGEPRGPDAVRGAVLYQRYCASCHGPDGTGESINAHYMPGIEWSDFTRPGFVADRGRERIRTAIEKGGRAVSGGSKWMPAYEHTFDAGQVDDLMALIVDFPRRPRVPVENLSTSDNPGCATCHQVAGRELVRQSNCAGCHRIEGFERRVVAPDLAGVGRKFTRQFLYRFLEVPFNRRQPGYIPLELVRMPDFRLTVAERVDLSEYLATLEELDLAEAYQPPVGLPPARLAEEAAAILDKYACIACHKLNANGGKIGPDLTDIGGGQWNPEWIYNWIRDPRRYFPESPMPDLGVSSDEARILTAFLTTRGSPTAWTAGHVEGVPEAVRQEPAYAAYPEFSAGEREAAAGRGRSLFGALGCKGCHPVGDEPWDPATDLVGPRLDAAGGRLERRWTFRFLWEPEKVRPDRVRPNLAPARMPRMRFTEDEVGSAIQYLADHSEARFGALRRDSEAEILAARSGPPDPEAGRRVFIEQDCHSCHEIAGESFPPVKNPYYSPEETARRRRWAPDLSGTARLETWWAWAWIHDPQRFDPDALMPKIQLTDGEIARLLDYFEKVRR